MHDAKQAIKDITERGPKIPSLGEMIQFDEHIFQMGGEKPPTRSDEKETQVEVVFFFIFEEVREKYVYIT